MTTKYKLTNKLGPNDQWIPHNGTLEFKTAKGVGQITGNNPYESYLIFILNVDNKVIKFICNSKTIKTEPATEDGFIENVFEGKAHLEGDITNQSNIKIHFGDYPNGNGKFLVYPTDGKCNYLETSAYCIKITDQIK